MSLNNSSSSERALEQRFQEISFEITPELLAKARAMIEATGSAAMRDSFETSLEAMPEPRRGAILVGI